MMRVVVLFILLWGTGATALADECRYQTRPNDIFFRGLPADIKGWVNCGENGPNIIYVGRTPSKNIAGWLDWFSKYQEIISPEPAELKVLKSGKSHDGIESHWIESRRSIGAIRHLLIIKPETRKVSLVFIQSANMGTGEAPAFAVPESLRRIVRAVDPALLDREFPLQ